MDVATPQSDLYSKLLQIGWTLKKISFRQGLYLAKASNETTGQEIERAAKSPEMALAAVLRYAQAADQVRRFAARSKFAAWDADFLQDGSEIAQAYSEMPPFEQKAVAAWKALAAESKIQADAIKRQITVEVVDDPEPYTSVPAMVEDIHKNRHVSVSRANTDHPVWSPEDVVNFRTVNDVIGHAQTGADYSWTGENKAFAVQAPLLSPMAREALFTETIGYAAYTRSFRGNGPHKIGFLSQFLHPVQERQGEHVWVPHGGLPELAPVDPMEQAMAQAQPPLHPAVQQGYTSPAFERPPAVMEGYKPTKIMSGFGWGEEPQFVTHIPCPSNIPIKPEREIECPDWTPNEEPLTVPEKWPEEAPSPEREKEPALTHVRVSNEDLPLYYSQEAGIGWKILLALQDGTLRSPSRPVEWPVGQPLVAEGDPADFARGGIGIHLVPEGHWDELYEYTDASNAVLVKCKLYGRYYEGTTESGKGILATKAMPVLVVGPGTTVGQSLLLKVANKYGIDTEITGGGEPTSSEGQSFGDAVFEEHGYKLVEGGGASYKTFNFNKGRNRGSGSRGTGEGMPFYVLDPQGQSTGYVKMRQHWDYSNRLDDLTVMEISADDDESQQFLREYFASLPVRAEYDRSEAWENGEWDYEYSDYRGDYAIQDAKTLIDFAFGSGSDTLKSLDSDSYSYEWDASDVEYELGKPDEYGICPWEITIKEQLPAAVDFDPDEWKAVFLEEIETLKSGWSEPDSADLAKALVEVPEFILTDSLQNGTPTYKAWESVGGFNYIRSEINGVRYQQDAEHLPLELVDWLYQLESALAGSAAPTNTPEGQMQVVRPVETWQKSDANEPDWKPWQEIHPDQEQIPGTLSKVAGRDPDYLFVYFKSELRVKKWEHDLRQADMLEELLDEFDVDMGNTGLDIDPAEVAAGEVYAYPDGEYRVEHKQLSNPEVREHAEDLLDEWLDEWRSLNQARDPATGLFV